MDKLITDQAMVNLVSQRNLNAAVHLGNRA
jgi:hypothetical protein